MSDGDKINHSTLNTVKCFTMCVHTAFFSIGKENGMALWHFYDINIWRTYQDWWLVAQIQATVMTPVHFWKVQRFSTTLKKKCGKTGRVLCKKTLDAAWDQPKSTGSLRHAICYVSPDFPWLWRQRRPSSQKCFGMMAFSKTDWWVWFTSQVWQAFCSQLNINVSLPLG